ncbi:MAG: hypothetical protein HY580_05205 [Nitrospinae bacterium]|nr:hypothetical protein [Nitrospinota bacterium]
MPKMTSNESQEAGKPWVPVFLGAAVSIGAAVLSRTPELNEKAHLQRTLELKTQKLKNKISEKLDSRVLGLVRMGQRFEMRSETPREEWENAAKNYVDRYRNFQAIEWADSQYRVQCRPGASPAPSASPVNPCRLPGFQMLCSPRMNTDKHRLINPPGGGILSMQGYGWAESPIAATWRPLIGG